MPRLKVATAKALPFPDWNGEARRLGNPTPTVSFPNILKRLVSATGIEPVTPTMSTSPTFLFQQRLNPLPQTFSQSSSPLHRRLDDAPCLKIEYAQALAIARLKLSEGDLLFPRPLRFYTHVAAYGRTVLAPQLSFPQSVQSGSFLLTRHHALIAPS